MAATSTGSENTARLNYYTISFGMLRANAKQSPEGYEETSLTDIKARRGKNENVDLRRKFYDTKNGSGYPLRVFYTDITGVIESVEKDKYDKNTNLKVTVRDTDGDRSVLQVPFYGKVSADFLNRLLTVTPENQLNFRPYSIPSEYTPEGGDLIKFFNSGVSVKDKGEKIARAFNRDSGLPPTEQVQNANGESETSRVNQVNFLWEKVEAKFDAITPQATTETPVTTTAPTPSKETTKEQPVVTANDDLPF